MKIREKHGDLRWFEQARFGMFIHWGIYALPARGEWVKSHERMTNEKYAPYFKFFEPDLFNPKEWAAKAKAAGMKYVVFTAKHHDGFCLWDTALTDYNSVKAPRCRRDFLRDVVDAFRTEGLRIGLYYSLPDWRHPGYVVDARHPLRDNPEAAIEPRDYASYTQFLHAQVTELLTRYGPVDIIWFDGSYPETEEHWQSNELAKLIRSIQPNIIITRLPGHENLATPEQNIPPNGVRDSSGKLLPWEGCQVFSGTWGYCRYGQNWKSVGEIIEMLIRHVSRGGNLLLNVSPTARGCLDPKSSHRLYGLAKWMHYHQRSIYNCTIAPAEFTEPESCRYTYNPSEKRLYLHLFSWPDRRIFLQKLSNRIEYAQLLHDGSEIVMTENNPGNTHSAKISCDTVMLALPVSRPEVAVPVIELFLR